MSNTTRLNEKSWTHDRSDWGLTGPYSVYWNNPTGLWHKEPDKVQWIDSATQYDCLAVRNNMGAWCGYVGVPPDHICYNKFYDDITVLDVHGGLTFSDLCDKSAEEGKGICHIPEPGRSDSIWWIGFDCSHHNDLSPRMPILSEISSLYEGTYRDLSYVQEECRLLALQLSVL